MPLCQPATATCDRLLDVYQLAGSLGMPKLGTQCEAAFILHWQDFYHNTPPALQESGALHRIVTYSRMGEHLHSAAALIKKGAYKDSL